MMLKSFIKSFKENILNLTINTVSYLTTLLLFGWILKKINAVLLQMEAKVLPVHTELCNEHAIKMKKRREQVSKDFRKWYKEMRGNEV